MQVEHYFPKGLALGKAFCNRQLEKKHLLNNIKAGQHTLVIAPRRYGKTSLVKQVLTQEKIVYGEADLFVAVDSKQIEQQITMAIKCIVQQCCSTLEQTIRILTDAFKQSSAKWLIGIKGLQLELTHDALDPATALLEALQALENVLAKKKIFATLFIDEIQEIGEVAQGRALEGAIRHVAQKTQYLSFIFSGSKRHLLSQMFYSQSRPLYKLCDKMTLQPIDEKHYITHLTHYAQSYWQDTLSDTVLKTIFTLTQRHPYYMNLLCLALWRACQKQCPTKKPSIIVLGKIT